MDDLALHTDYLGIDTVRDPLKVARGFMVRAQNARVDDGCARVRGGMALIDASGLTGTHRGGGFFEHDGNVYYVFALDGGGAAPDVRLYYSVYNGSAWSGPTQILSSGYGTPLLNNPATGLFTFTGVPGLYGTKYVVVQNGVDAPWVLTLATFVAAPSDKVEAPSQAQSYRPAFTVGGFLDIGAATPTVSIVGSGTAEWVPSGVQWMLTMTGTPPAGDQSAIYNTPTLDLSGSEQVCLVVSPSAGSTIDDLLRHFKIDIRDSAGNYYTIHDPLVGIDNSLVVRGVGDAYYWVYFPVGEHRMTAALNNINGLRATIRRADPFGGGSRSWAVAAVTSTGKVPFGAQYALAFKNTGTQTESPSVVLENPFEAEPGAAVVGSTVSVFSNLTPPLAEGVYYTVKVPVFAPGAADRDKGVDYVRVFRKDPEDADFYLAGSVQVSEFTSPNWVYKAPFSTTVNRSTFVDTTPRWGKAVDDTAPGAYNEPLPKGQAGAYSGDRLYFGARAGSGGKAAVKVSDKRFPFRFRALPISGEEDIAGYESVLDGEREITAVVPGSSSVVGGGFVYVFTRKACYTVADYMVSKIADLGAAGSHAWAIEDNRLYFLDQDRQVRMMAGGIANLSRTRVHNHFLAATSLDKAVFARHQGRLYVRLADKKVLVYSDFLGEWESVDETGGDIVQFLRWDFLGESRLCLAGKDSDLVQYESGSTDLGEPVVLGLTWPEIMSPDWNTVRVGEPYIVNSDLNGGLGTFVLTSKGPEGESQSGTVDLDAGGSAATNWRKATGSGRDIRVRGFSVRVDFNASLTSPFKLYAVKVKADLGGRDAKS